MSCMGPRRSRCLLGVMLLPSLLSLSGFVSGQESVRTHCEATIGEELRSRIVQMMRHVQEHPRDRHTIQEGIEGYLQYGGQFYDPEENFQNWAPDNRWDYNNVAYGLLAYLVERISGESFSEYCQNHVFQPLEMNETSWYLADIDVSRHVVPYTYVEGDDIRSPTWGGRPLGVILEDGGSTVPQGDGHHANCAYNHPNFPDGFLRTSVRQLSWFARAYLNGGILDGRRILEESTVQAMLATQRAEPSRKQGLTWYSSSLVRGQEVWGHGGSDPGINTDIRLLPDEGTAAIVFINTWGGNPSQITHHLLEEAPKF